MANGWPMWNCCCNSLLSLSLSLSFSPSSSLSLFLSLCLLHTKHIFFLSVCDNSNDSHSSTKMQFSLQTLSLSLSPYLTLSRTLSPSFSVDREWAFFNEFQLEPLLMNFEWNRRPRRRINNVDLSTASMLCVDNVHASTTSIRRQRPYVDKVHVSTMSM